MPLLVRAAEHARMGRILAYDMYSAPSNKDRKIAYSYHDILSASAHLHKYFRKIKKQTSANDPQRIAYLCPPGPQYISTQFACWSSGSIAVPLCISHRANELAYVLKDCDPSLVIDGTSNPESSEELKIAAAEVGITDRYHCLDDLMLGFDSKANSGTYALGSDVTDLVTSWAWSKDDAILHFLPLHHVHGIINKLACCIWAGGSVEFVKFDPVKIWERLAETSRRIETKSFVKSNENSEEYEQREPTVFMAVPTVYAKMLEVAEARLPENIDFNKCCSHLRLMVSGSAALPAGIHRRWKELTGHTILERYGMTEFAMALSNPLDPVEKRLPGYVGLPLPSVEVKIISETGDTIPKQTAESGELYVRGPTVFQEYWQKEDATRKSFDAEGFFKTGDVVAYDAAVDSYRVLGRLSADIIKCSGYKISALEIERELLEHPDLAEVVVLGIPDDIKGESVALICRPSSSNRHIELKEVQAWCRKRIASYKIPSVMLVMEDIPKNAMGKVSKKQLVQLFH
ncbi:malonate-CoA ligase [Skeletonema marinoi]|uniref:Malonate-CoA ligase n=1 Tax=Skeletonema marinoi TaxID=267567 RepID=A0AAD9DHC3_9STRA|nr:malonate-CoA ligase [Skeletonema marinoi]